ncbi:serine--tRNA ligase-like protein [Tanacetum coccineum]
MESVKEIKLPPKEKDPKIFILPYSIGNLTVRNALTDLGASISTMPLSMYKSLCLGKPKPVNMIVEMSDRTKSIPKGIVENLMVKIDKFRFLVDFVILDMVEDFRMPIILGRPLLATTHAEIDVFRKLISLEDWVSIIHGKVDKMTEQIIWNDCWKKGLRGSSNHDEENGDAEELVTAYTEEEGYAVTNDQVEESGSIKEEDPDGYLDPENFDDEKRAMIRELIEGRLDDNWYTGTPVDDDDLDCLVEYLGLQPHDDHN